MRIVAVGVNLAWLLARCLFISIWVRFNKYSSIKIERKEDMSP